MVIRRKKVEKRKNVQKSMQKINRKRRVRAVLLESLA